MCNTQYKLSSQISIGIWALLMSAPINNLIDVISLLLIDNTIIVIHDIIRYIAIFFIGILLFKTFKEQAKIIIVSLLLLGFLWYYSGLRHPDLIPYLQENTVPFFIECLPYLWIFNYIIKVDLDEPDFDAFSYFYSIYKVKLIFALLAQAIMFVFPETDIFHDYMNAANAILVGLLFVTIYNLKTSHESKFSFYLEILGILFILLLGSRGGTLCYLSVYFFYYVFISEGANKRRGILFGLILFSLFILFLPLIISSFGDNRLVDLFSSQKLFNDEERQVIFAIMIYNISLNPWGMGIMADRDLLINSTEVWDVFYAHNFFLEMGIDFGYIGIVIAIIFVVVIIRSLMREEFEYKCIIDVLLCSSVIKLMVSSSFWTDPIIWALLGVILALRKKREPEYEETLETEYS